MPTEMWALFLAVLSLAWTVSAGEDTGARYAVIFIGLPGDDEHAALFAETSNAWRKWLTETMDFEPQRVWLLPEPQSEREEAKGITAAVMQEKLADLASRLKKEDALWVFTLGHGNYDGKQAWFHVSGRDPSGADLAAWCEGLKCSEQVFWLTQSNSGWFVKPLSRPGRIIVAASAADDESNETEFPHALAAVARLPIEKLDADRDQQVSLAELFAAALVEVNQRFEKTRRLPTEHPQLDDNGDGKGSENIAAAATDEPAKADGELARETRLPYRTTKRMPAN